MTELQLHKFVTDKELECAWRGDDLILWLDFSCAEEFAALIEDFLTEKCEVDLQLTGLALDIVPLCQYYDIDPGNIVGQDNDDDD